MAIATMRVPTLFTAVDRFSDVVSKMTNKTTAFGKTAGSAISRVDHKINGLWGSMNSMSQLAIGGGIGGLFYYAGKDVMEYDKVIHSLGAVTGTVVGSMNKQIESLGKETGRSVIDIAKGFEQVGSKMSEYLGNPDALKMISAQGILMANASRMSAEDSIDNLTSLMNQFGKGYKDANMIVNKLSAGEDIGASTIPETIDILRQFAASARMAGAGVAESVAMVQTVTKTLGKQGVGRNFRNIMVDLNTGKGMDKNKLKALSMVGINIEKMINPATTFLEKMKELTKLSGNKQAMGMFFKKTGMEAGSTFLREFATFEKYLAFIEKTNSATEKASKNNSTLSYIVDRLKDSFTNFVVTGNDAGVALKIVKGLVGWMIDNMGSLISLIMSVTIAFLAWKGIVLVISIINGVMATFNAIMAIHRFIVLWATLTNVSYVASLWAVAAATLAAYWPLLLIAGALGVLVYSMWDSKKATDSMVGGQISSLDKGNLAWKNSTNVMGAELGKQKTLLNNMPNNEKVFSNMANARNFKKATAIANTLGKPLPQNTKDVGNLFSMYNSSSPAIKKTIDESSNYNENLAGKNWLTDLKDIIFNSTSSESKVKLEIYAPEDYKVKPFDIPKGLEVKTNSNQGAR